jgi:hypothetical protein
MTEFYDRPPKKYSNNYLIRFDRDRLKEFSKTNRPEQALAQALVYNCILIGIATKTKNKKELKQIGEHEFPKFYHSLTDFESDLYYLVSFKTISRAIKKLKENGDIVNLTERKLYTNTYFGIPVLAEFCEVESLRIKNGISLGYKGYRYYDKVHDCFIDFNDLVQLRYAPKKHLGLLRSVIFENLNKMIISDKGDEENKFEEDGYKYRKITISGLLTKSKIFSSFGIDEDTFAGYLKLYDSMGLLKVKKDKYKNWNVGIKLGETYIEVDENDEEN